MFKKIKDLFRSEPSPSQTAGDGFSLPYDLTEGQWRSLQSLAAQDEWDVWTETLDAAVNSIGEALLAADDTERVHFFRGYIQGLRKAGSLIDEIRYKEEAHAENERKRTERSEPDALQRAAALLGTPAWGRDGAERRRR